MNRYVVALDQGTTSSRAIVFDASGTPVGSAQKEFAQIYPQPGWVEHDPLEIWSSQKGVLYDALSAARVEPRQLAAIGITNQRETTIVWDRKTGRPIYHAIVWQCRRTAPLCEELRRDGFAERVAKSTGLVLDAYFSATKVKWILDTVPGARKRAENGELAFGTVDTWLLWHLTGGKTHATDFSNASRTMMFDISALTWDREILARLGIPEAMLPEVRPSSGDFGVTEPELFDGVSVPVAGVAGDQHAALFGQACFEPGSAKNTYGTGCFLMMNTGTQPVPSKNGLLTTIAWHAGGAVEYALEGSIFVAGAVVQWLRDEVGLIREARDTELFAREIADTLGVYVVPAFVGLGAPHWDMYARGAIVGLTRGAGRNHIVRAALESIAYQTRDVIHALEADSGIPLGSLKVDGGAVVNDFLMQFQADMLRVPVVRPRVTETTALGAAYLAGLAVGVWKSKKDIQAQWQAARTFEPEMSAAGAERLYAGWQDAVARVRSHSGA